MAPHDYHSQRDTARREIDSDAEERVLMESIFEAFQAGLAPLTAMRGIEYLEIGEVRSDKDLSR